MIDPAGLSLLGQVVFAESPAWREEYAELADQALLRPLLYWRFSRQLPLPLQKLCRDEYQKRAFLSMQRQAVLRELAAEMAAAGIAYIPLKGAFLAFEVYPEPALRPFIDLDILVQRKQLAAFERLLSSRGWTARLNCHSDHHAGVRKRGGLYLEPHFNLPNFPEGSEELIWQESCASGGQCRQLSSELTLLMLCQHNSICQFQQTVTLKLLLDVGFLLQKHALDWEKVAGLARTLHLPHPGLLLKSFPEYFPASRIPEFASRPAVVASYRELLLHPRHFTGRQTEIELASATWSGSYLKRRLRGLTAGSICWKYHLSPGDFWRIQVYRLFDLGRKIWQLCYLGQKRLDAPLQEHLQRVKIVENSWR